MEHITISSDTQSSVLYYKVLVKNSRWRELWRLTKPNLLAFAVGGFVKLFRIDLPVTHAFAMHELVKLDLSEVPATILAQLAEEREQLCNLGFFESSAFTIPVLGNGENYALVFHHPAGDRVGGVFYQRLEQKDVEELQTGIAISSRSLDEGHIYTTTNMARRLDSPEGCFVEMVHHDSVSKVNAHHSRKLESSGKRFEKLAGDQVWQLLEDCHQLEVADQIARGVITEISSDEWMALR